MLKQIVCWIFVSGLLCVNAFVHGSPTSTQCMLRAESNLSTRQVRTRVFGLRNDNLMTNISDYANYLQHNSNTDTSELLPKPLYNPKTPRNSPSRLSLMHFNTTTAQRIEMCHHVDKQLTNLKQQITECKHRLDKMAAYEESLIKALLLCDDLKLLEKQTSSCIVYKENLTEERKLFFLRDALQNLTENLYRI